MVQTRNIEQQLDVKILSSLASDDSKRIFFACEKGIEKSSKAMKELGCSQKRYYTLLKRLINAGLVEKRENVYVQTMLGKFCHRVWKSFLNVLSQQDRMELADRLMRSATLLENEKERILRLISNNALMGTAELADIMHEVKMIVDYDRLIDEVIGLLDNAKESVYMAANKFDSKVMGASFRAIDRGLKFYFLSSEDAGFSESIEALRLILLDPEAVKIVRRLINSREINVMMTEEQLLYSFIVVDSEYGIIELPYPTNHYFQVAFKFKNAYFCKKLVEIFKSIYDKGKEDSRISFAKRFLSLRR